MLVCISMIARTSWTVLFAIALLLGSCGRRARVVSTGPSGPNGPPQDEVFYRQGLADFHQGTPESYARAAEAFRRASQLRPQRCEYALNLAQALLFLAAEQLLNWEEYEPRQTEAAALVDAAGPACVASFEPFTLRLRALIAGRGPTASELINRAVDLDPNDAMNWLVLGYLDPTSHHVSTADGSGKWVAASRAVEIQPDSALLQYELARNSQLFRDKATLSRPAFERAIALNPRHFRAYLGLAYTADENEDVEPFYKRVVEIAPTFLEGRTAFGQYYSALDDFENATEQFAAAIAINPRYDVAHFGLGLLNLHADRPNEAEKHFTTVIALTPASYEAFYYLGNIAYDRKELDRARARYDEALKVRPTYPEAEYGLGHVFRQQNQNDLAIAQFDKVVKLQPRYCDAYLSRGDIRAERRQLPDALADYDKAVTCYQQQVKSLEAAIAFANEHLQSRALQVEKKRNERDKARTEALLQLARQFKSEVETNLKKTP